MRERDEGQHNSSEPKGKPYWQEDVAVGEGRFFSDPYTIRLRLHTTRERYRGKEELYPLNHKTGERLYLHGRPYILVPEITLTIGLHSTPRPSGEIGKVESSEWTGMRHQELGNAQGWFYPADGVAVLWEAFLNDHWRQEHPTEDENLKVLWSGFEELLLARCPAASRIVTPSWENLYEEPAWQEFLRQEGYQAFSAQAFVKELGGV